MLVGMIFHGVEGGRGWGVGEYCADAILGDEGEEVVWFDVGWLGGHFGW